jgi:hypothetical protein
LGFIDVAAFRVRDDLEQANQQRDGIEALKYRCDQTGAGQRRAIAPGAPFQGRSKDLWTTVNRVEENLVRRGLHGCAANDRAVKTREVRGIVSND